jgi:hypothetical protein
MEVGITCENAGNMAIAPKTTNRLVIMRFLLCPLIATVFVAGEPADNPDQYTPPLRRAEVRAGAPRFKLTLAIMGNHAGR